ncbi:patatin-like phospholipase family protein [Candidatus Leptofilum sp.]|uniref:patatin-like phospholipase family protein n=1 Tax=Candidatus Leptofilum sp. TaxID=3241576 RepID=UPI003B5AF91A
MKIGYALGGGGARGAAHIGVLMELERLGIRPNLITGTSIGGLVGALYASGLTCDDLADCLREINIASMYSFSGTAPALTGVNKIEQLLASYIGRPKFSELGVPLAVVTTDLVSRKEVILDEGDVITAVLATIAIPILFPPVERDGMVLSDGGILNNTPFDIARARGANYVIAVDLSNTAPFGTPDKPAPTPTGVLGRALALTQRRKTWQIMSVVADIITAQTLQKHLAVSRPEILLQPNMGSIGLFDFHRLDEGIKAGQTAVREIEEQLVTIDNKTVGRRKQ